MHRFLYFYSSTGISVFRKPFNTHTHTKEKSSAAGSALWERLLEVLLSFGAIFHGEHFSPQIQHGHPD